MGKDAKKAVVSDEWRSKDVEERLSYSLIKVNFRPFIFWDCRIYAGTTVKSLVFAIILFLLLIFVRTRFR